ncbi:MAG: histidine--tRNA ligase [Candidatus Amoebophilus sp.]
MQEKQTPQLVKGTRDFDALQVAQRSYIFDTIRQVYQKYGFSPLETPALEYVSTLFGQYGQEGEQLVFRVLNSGNFLVDTPQALLIEQNYKEILPKITEKGLRYDLTVPLMRYVATHYHELTLPFRRYQIQPVWRADRPQKGRYREFYQCDADVVGTPSLIVEAEILAMAYEVLQRLGINDFIIHLNHRSILNGIASQIGELERVNEFCTIVDKLDKVGKDKVIAELLSKGFSKAGLEKFDFIFDLQGDNNAKLDILSSHLAHDKVGSKGLQELKEILQYLEALGMTQVPISFEPSLARGLAYYTGAVFEVKLPTINIGSIAGGGRYDNLAEHFGVSGLTGVGFSFGVDRLYVAMEQLNLFPQQAYFNTKVMITNLDEESVKVALDIITRLRNHDIPAELYPEKVKLKKQLMYANKKDIPFVLIIGEEESQSSKFTLKNMTTGDQAFYTFDQLINILSN